VKKLLLVLVVVGVGLAAAAAIFPVSSSSGNDNGYGYEPAEIGSLTEIVSPSGPVQPKDAAAVGTLASGEVKKIAEAADFNRHVDKGQFLLQVDDEMPRLKRDLAKVQVEAAAAGIKQAEAQLKAARVALQYQIELLNAAESPTGRKRKEEAEHQVDAAKAGLEAAKVKELEAQETLKQAQLGVDWTTVKAPVSGTIIDRKVEVGQMIGPPASNQLFTIARDLKQVEVQTQVPEGDITKIKKGLKASFTVSSPLGGNVNFDGEVREIRPLPIANQGAVYYPVLIDVTNKPNGFSKDWILKPGMNMNVDITCRTHDHVWKMPQSALNFQPDPPLETEAARAKLAEWDKRKDRDDWKPVWVLRTNKEGHKELWPVFVRIGGVNARNETGISDSLSTEVLEWDPEFKPDPQAKSLDFVIKAPPAHKPGLFEKMNIKLP
jgi:HlyD family secretion protein